jgi:hypothetical protein
VSATVIDFRTQGRPGAGEDAPGLGAFLLQLAGEPFLFARFSYADELTLHFGAAREAKHPKLRVAGLKYGSHVLRTRGSAWLLKPGARPIVVTEGLADFIDPAVLASEAKPITHREVEAGDFLTAGAMAVAVRLYAVHQVEGIGVRVGLSDGSAVVVIPTPDEQPPEGSPPGPELADWELQTPHGTAKVGPGRKWVLDPVPAA